MHAGAGAAIGGEHAVAEVERERAVAGALQVDAQVAGAGGEVDHRAALGQGEHAHRLAPPAHVEPERHDPVDEVVAGSDRVEHLADGGDLLLALGQGVAIPTALVGRRLHGLLHSESG